jgi:hypothetical protein
MNVAVKGTPTKFTNSFLNNRPLFAAKLPEMMRRPSFADDAAPT